MMSPADYWRASHAYFRLSPGGVGQVPVAASRGPGWHYNYAAPYAGPSTHYPQYYPPGQPGQPGLPAPPTPSPCPPGYEWTPAGVYDKWSKDVLGFWHSTKEYFGGGCCPSDWQYSPIQSGCIPPINVPPAYNPCQPGWTYHSGHCCPPGWKWDKFTEQCVPI